MLQNLFSRGYLNAPQQRALATENERLNRDLGRTRQQLGRVRTTLFHHKEDAARARVESDSLLQHVYQERDELREANRSLANSLKEHKAKIRVSQQMKTLLQNAEAENLKLQEQILQYKKTISSTSQLEGQVADDVIKGKSEDIFYSIQDFVVANFRGKPFGMTSPTRQALASHQLFANHPLDFHRLPKETKAIMKRYAPTAEKLPKPFWRKIITSVIAGVMIESFEPESVFGSSELMPVAAALTLAKEFPGMCCFNSCHRLILTESS